MIDRLLATEHTRGGWAYKAGAPACSEPTSVAVLALIAHHTSGSPVNNALAWLAGTQHPDGGMPISREVKIPCWPTGLATLALLASSDSTSGAFRGDADKSVEWLLRTGGRTFESDPRVYGHDTTLSGWPWVEDTHTWLEPTAYAILALRAAGRGGHPRVREAVRLTFDRAIPEGGWNYGNRRMFGADLRPFPGTTGIVLAALAGEPADSRIEGGIEHVARELVRVRSPMSLGWGLIGLSAWNRRPREAQNWLAESADRALRRAANPLEDALLLIAGASVSPIVTTAQIHSKSVSAVDHG